MVLCILNGSYSLNPIYDLAVCSPMSWHHSLNSTFDQQYYFVIFGPR